MGRGSEKERNEGRRRGREEMERNEGRALNN